MDVLYPYCAGIDVHKKTVSVCVLTPGTPAKPHQQVREFGTTTRELLELADWLLQNQVTHVGMESTGVYWKPIWNILEAAGFTLTLANAQQSRTCPAKRPIRPTVSGWRNCCAMDSCPPALCRRLRCVNSGTSHEHGPRWCGNERPSPIACRKRWRTPTSNSAMWSVTSWASPAGPCSRASWAVKWKRST